MGFNLSLTILTILFGLAFLDNIQSHPTPAPSNFFATSLSTTSTDISNSPNEDVGPQPAPDIVKIDIKSNIQYRYAKTIVKSYIKNPSPLKSQEVTFNMVLPNTAFISNFTIQVKGEEKVYIAKVFKKEDAQKSYNEAILEGQSAGIVDADTRDANQITVRSNLKAASKMEFTLTYEELLQRHTQYEHIIHVNPGQIVNDFKVNIYINESLPLTNINVPELKTSPNEITSTLEKNSIAKIEKNITGNPKWAHVQFKPTIDDQKRMAKLKNGRALAENGMSGQFIVQYDVDRKAQGSDIQVLDGYFVHFFAPDYLPPLPKHVVFVLDTSGSMLGVKLEQTKDAMVTILDDLSDKDYFNIVTFSDKVTEWIPVHYIESRSDPLHHPLHEYGDYDYFPLDQTTLPPKPAMRTYQGTDLNIKAALKFVLDLEATGGTNINLSLLDALKVVQDVALSESVPSNTKPMIIFLTDGEPTVGEQNGQNIRNNILDANKDLNVPIYGLAFGTGADFTLVKAIGTESGAFSRTIFEASDAAIQLEDFYSEIASPLLTNVKFDYVGESLKNKTNKKSNTFFKGNEYIIAGKFDVLDDEIEEELVIIITGNRQSHSSNDTLYQETIKSCPPLPPRPLPSFNGTEIYIDYQNYPESRYPCIPWPRPTPVPREPKSEAENFIERLWAFLTIENLMDEKKSKTDNTIESLLDNMTNSTVNETISKPKSNEEKALELAIEYNFVTQLTSLVVVKPAINQTHGMYNSSETIVNPLPVDSLSPGYHQRPYFPRSYQPQSVHRSIGAGPPGPRGSVGRGFQGPRRPSPRIVQSCPSCMMNINMLMRGPPGPPMPQPNLAMMSYDDDEYQDDVISYSNARNIFRNRIAQNSMASNQLDNGPGMTGTVAVTDVNLDIENCSISLFSKTYLRGENLIITGSAHVNVTDLSAESFDDKLASLEVIGPCCWEIYQDTGFNGNYKKFQEGKYKSSSKLGSALTKDASSLKLIAC